MEFLGLRKVYDENYSFSGYCVGLAALMVNFQTGVGVSAAACPRADVRAAARGFLTGFPASGRPWRPRPLGLRTEGPCV